MIAEHLVKLLPMTGAALAIPAAAKGTFAAYESYFSSDVTCQKLRNNVIAIMESSALARPVIHERDALTSSHSGGRDVKTALFLGILSYSRGAWK
jgi:hypothetical protein